MKTAILGGGITGLVAAHKLSKKNHTVFLFEKEPTLGGMAGGFKEKNWNWFLERTYHHIFKTDCYILNFLSSLEYGGVFFSEPKTVSFYPPRKGENNYRTFPVDTPQDFLRFPLLSLPQKLRAGAVLAFLKISPFFSLYEKHTAQEFLKKTMGEGVWSIMWEELFRKKFGKYAENILASFIWARIKMRTNKLGYMQGGFQALVDFIEQNNVDGGVLIHKQTTVMSVEKRGKKYTIVFRKNNEEVQREDFDVIISTLPTPVFIKTTNSILPTEYIKRLSTIKYLHAVNLILETKKPVFYQNYWINICDKKAPMMALVQHTNFIGKENYNNSHILYIANYVGDNDPLLVLNKEEITQYHLPYLKNIQPEIQIISSHLFKTPFGQPIFDKEFLSNMPTFETPLKNLYIANLDMTYPFDRGTNYAVKLGLQVASLL